jgi:hypothetical protein
METAAADVSVRAFPVLMSEDVAEMHAVPVEEALPAV